MTFYDTKSTFLACFLKRRLFEHGIQKGRKKAGLITKYAGTVSSYSMYSFRGVTEFVVLNPGCFRPVIICAAKSNKMGEIYNVGSNQSVSVNRIVKLLLTFPFQLVCEP